MATLYRCQERRDISTHFDRLLGPTRQVCDTTWNGKVIHTETQAEIHPISINYMYTHEN